MRPVLVVFAAATLMGSAASAQTIYAPDHIMQSGIEQHRPLPNIEFAIYKDGGSLTSAELTNASHVLKSCEEWVNNEVWPDTDWDTYQDQELAFTFRTSIVKGCAEDQLNGLHLQVNILSPKNPRD
jgi:hypothetical protein